MSPEIQPANASKIATEPSGPINEHLIAMQELAKDFDLPIGVVAKLYWPELARLEQGATIDLYLPLLTERHVRHKLRHMPRSDHVRTGMVSNSVAVEA